MVRKRQFWAVIRVLKKGPFRLDITVIKNKKFRMVITVVNRGNLGWLLGCLKGAV